MFWLIWSPIWIFAVVSSTTTTDSVRDADEFQSGYSSSHFMDPFVVSGPTFGKLWTTTTPGVYKGNAEQFYARPLVYTSPGGNQYLIAASENNFVHVLDAVTGRLMNSRQVAIPINSADISCNDLTPQVGITGTPIIANDYMYFFGL